MATSMLRALATSRTPTEPVLFRYNPVSQISEVFEGRTWVPSWASRCVAMTKKCDAETGEDQKGQ